MKKMNERETWIDFLKGFAMIGVIIGHICQGLLKAGFYASWGNIIIEFFYSFHMPMMFGLSGYLAAYSCIKEKYSSFGSYIIDNFISLYIPNIIFIFLWWGIKAFIYSGNEMVSLMSLFMGYGSFWFLPMLLVIRVIHGSLEWIDQKENLNMLFWCVCFLVTVVLYIYSGILPKVLYRVSFGIFYELGYMLKKLRLLEKDKINGKGILLSLLMIIIGILLPGKVNCIYKKFFTGVGISFLCIVIVKNKKLRNKKLEFIGRNSMVYYLFPLCITAMFRMILNFIGIHQFLIQLVLGTLATLITTHICIWSYTNIESLNWVKYIFYPAKMRENYEKNRLVR